MSGFMYITGKIGVFIDESNIYHSQKNLGWKIDYLKIKRYLSKYADISILNLYTSFLNEDIFTQKRFTNLENNGYKIIKKKLKFIKNKEGFLIKKGNLDVELALDAYRLKNEYETLILFSGDSDFKYLAELLKKDKKKIVVFSTASNISRELILCSDHYFEIKRFKDKFM